MAISADPIKTQNASGNSIEVYESLRSRNKAQTASYDLFFKRDRPNIVVILNDYAKLYLPIAAIVADYVVGDRNPFGTEEWRGYFGVDVGPEPDLGEVRRFWLSLDPYYQNTSYHGTLVCETHYPPVLLSRAVTRISTKSSHDFNLKILDDLVKHPQTGRSSKISDKGDDISIFETLNIHTCWLVVRRSLLGDDLSSVEKDKYMKNLNTETSCAYEITPSAIDIATSVFTRFVCQVEKEFEETDLFNPCYYSHCKAMSNGEEVPGMIRFHVEDGLILRHGTSEARRDVGVAGVRKFY